MKVVHISTSKHGGAGIAAFRIHEALNKFGEIDSYFLQRTDNDDIVNKTYQIKAEIKKENFLSKIKRRLNLTNDLEYRNKRNEINKSRNFEIATFPESSFRIEDHPLIKDADIIHLHWVADFLNYPTFFKRIKKPIVWTLHDMNPFQGLFHYKNDEINNEETLGDFDKKILKEKIKSIHKNKKINIITLCNWMHEESSKSEAFKKYTHSIIPNFIDFDKYPLLNRKEQKTKLNIDNGLKTLMFIAQDINNHRKGFDLLLTSLKNITEKVNIITIGGEKTPLNSNFNHVHIKKIDKISELNAYYAASDLVLLTSREDNLPNVMLEAMANGTPVASFKIGGMKDWIIDNKTGILVDPFDADQFRKELEKFINGQVNFNHEEIYNYAKKNFDVNTNIEKIINLYKKILK